MIAWLYTSRSLKGRKKILLGKQTSTREKNEPKLDNFRLLSEESTIRGENKLLLEFSKVEQWRSHFWYILCTTKVMVIGPCLLALSKSSWNPKVLNAHVACLAGWHTCHVKKSRRRSLPS